MIKISVVVATYRRDAELGNALESLATQTFRDFEVIVVDDNGVPEWNDRVARVIDAFRSSRPEIECTYIRNEKNIGSAATRNVGIAQSRGEYVSFLDDDDVYLPEKLSEQYAFMTEGGYDYSLTDLELYDENEKLSDRRVRSYIRDTSKEALQVYHLMYHLTGTDTLIFRKEYLEAIGGFAPIDIGDEYYLMQRAIEGGGAFGYLPGCRVRAYVHKGGVGLSSGDKKIEGEKALYEYKKKFFPRVDRKTRRYVRMRHYAVMAFAQLKQKKLLSVVLNGVHSIMASPVGFIRMLLDRSRES